MSLSFWEGRDVNEAANGLIHSQTALAVLPGGQPTYLQEHLDFQMTVEATGILLETMDKANPKSVGLGCVNGRYFYSMLEWALIRQ